MVEDDTAGAISPCSTIIQSLVVPDIVYYREGGSGGKGEDNYIKYIYMFLCYVEILS